MQLQSRTDDIALLDPWVDGADYSLTASEIAERMLTDIRSIAPDVIRRSAEFEAERRIPIGLVETLRSIGVFRMLAPRSHGGLELELPKALEILSALSRIDGSFGWTAMIGCGA